MKILIAYAGKTGTTQKAATLLSEHFEDADLSDLGRTNPDPRLYDFVIIGSAVRNGMVMKPVRKWVTARWDVLKEKKKAVFICNAFIEQAPKLLKDNFSLELRNSSVIVDSFGGELDPEKLGGLERFMTKMALKRMRSGGAEREVLPVLLTDRILAFADAVNEASLSG